MMKNFKTSFLQISRQIFGCFQLGLTCFLPFFLFHSLSDGNEDFFLTNYGLDRGGKMVFDNHQTVAPLGS